MRTGRLHFRETATLRAASSNPVAAAVRQAVHYKKRKTGDESNRMVLDWACLPLTPMTMERAQAAELQTELKLGRPNPNIPSGIVPGIRRPSAMVPLKIVPGKQKRPIPFYATLRAAVDPPFVTRGEGKLYIGFHLDPLYAVHWNNGSSHWVQALEFRLDSRGSPGHPQPRDRPQGRATRRQGSPGVPAGHRRHRPQPASASYCSLLRLR